MCRGKQIQEVKPKFGYRTLQMQKEVQDKNFFEAKNSNGMSDLAKCQTCGLRVYVNCCQW